MAASTPASPAPRATSRTLPVVDSLFYIAVSLIVIGAVSAFFLR